MDEAARPMSALKFDALRNAIYHSSRAKHFARLNRWSNFLVVIFGASAVGDVGSHVGIQVAWLAALATIAGAVQLVFDFSGKGLKHEQLQRSFYEAGAELAECENPDETFRQKLDAKLQRLYGEEPPPMRALDAIAYNAASDSLGYGHGDRLVVTPMQSLLRQFFSFENVEFKWVKEQRPA